MIIKREIEIAKEVDDVGALLESIVRDIKAKKSLTEIATGNVAKLVTAIDKIDQMDDESKANRKVFLETIGRRTGGMADALLPAPKTTA